MKNLADTTELIEKTTSLLMSGEESATTAGGIVLIDQWITVLSESENTQPIAQELQKLRVLIESDRPDPEEVYVQMGMLAAKVLSMAPDIGAEGEMPSLLSALATALRMGSDGNEKK